MKHVKLALTLFAMSAFFLGQAQHKYTLEADKAFEAKAYMDAAELYKKASSKEKDRDLKAHITFRLAECYRFVGDWKRAEGYYKRVTRGKDADPIATLYMADMMKFQGEYEDAMEVYNQYRTIAPSDERGSVGVESCKKAIEWMETPTRYDVTGLRDFNSKQNDFAPNWADKEQNALFFTSQRDEAVGKATDGWTGQGFMDIFITQQEKKRGRSRRGQASDAEPKWSQPTPLEEPVNTADHEGFASLNERGNVMFFTRCRVEKKKEIGCEIWMSRKQGRNWGDPEKIEIPVDSVASIGHPCLANEDKLLYFAADMEGGYGGRDLWVSEFENRGRKWGTPRNLGNVINTEGDELFPFLHSDGYLYFSSNGHLGMGGLDVFRAKINEDGSIGEVENLQYPINTNADDFSIIWKGDDVKEGYMSSNRDGGRGGDDLYKVYLKPLLYTLSGVVTDAKTGRVINGVSVKMVGSDGTAVETTTDQDGAYFFDVTNFQEEQTYTLNFERRDYLTKSGNVTTVGIPLSAFEQTTDGYLHAMVHNKVLDPVKKPIVLPRIEYDFNKWDLRPEAMESLDDLVLVLEDNPNIVIELRSHTDHIGSNPANMQLSQRRAQSCVDYLVENGIDEERLVAKGMGESEPYVIPDTWEGVAYIQPGDRLTEAFIGRIAREYGEEADSVLRQLNRRTDFKVIRDNYVPKEDTGSDVDNQQKENNSEGTKEEE
jgi:peptidoglycan-associated lipoprotein